MSNAIQMILTMGILGAGAFAVYQARKGPQQPQEAYAVYPATYAPPQPRSLKDRLLGGLSGSLVESRAGGSSPKGSFLDRFLGGFLGHGGAGMTASTDYKTPYAGDIGQRLMGDLQRDFNLTRPQAAGIVGNLDHESGGFASLQEINPTVAGSRGGYGYAQWTGPRRRNFEAWANQNGLPTASYEANYGFLRHELTNTWEKRAIPRLQRTSSADEAAVVFQDTFLRPGIPHTESRKRRARRYA